MQAHLNPKKKIVIASVSNAIATVGEYIQIEKPKKGECLQYLITGLHLDLWSQSTAKVHVPTKTPKFLQF
jgi:hypothetical protein